jgi:hypothetical protein
MRRRFGFLNHLTLSSAAICVTIGAARSPWGDIVKIVRSSNFQELKKWLILSAVSTAERLEKKRGKLGTHHRYYIVIHVYVGIWPTITPRDLFCSA